MARKARLRAVAVAVELRRLRMQQQRQRIVAGMAARDIGMRAGRGRIAMADREQPVGDGMPAARLTAFAPAAPDSLRQCARARAISLQTSIAATMTTPSASANTGSEVSTRQPPHDSTTSPV